MDVTPRKSAMKKPRPKAEEATLAYAMDIETPEDAKRIRAKRLKGKTPDDDNTREFGDNAPTQTYVPDSERTTPSEHIPAKTLPKSETNLETKETKTQKGSPHRRN